MQPWLSFEWINEWVNVLFSSSFHTRFRFALNQTNFPSFFHLHNFSVFICKTDFEHKQQIVLHFRCFAQLLLNTFHYFCSKLCLGISIKLNRLHILIVFILIVYNVIKFINDEIFDLVPFFGCLFFFLDSFVRFYSLGFFKTFAVTITFLNGQTLPSLFFPFLSLYFISGFLTHRFIQLLAITHFFVFSFFLSLSV